MDHFISWLPDFFRSMGKEDSDEGLRGEEDGKRGEEEEEGKREEEEE